MKYKLHTVIILVFAIISSFTLFSQPIPADSLYLGQTPPGTTPKIFNLSVDTGYAVTERIAISPDGKEIYYGEIKGATWRTKCYTYSDSSWSSPFVLFDNYDAPALSPGGDTMFLLQFHGIIAYSYFSVRNDTGWNPPSQFGRGSDLYYLQVTNAGNYYVSTTSSIGGLGNGDISKMVISNSDTTYYSLGAPLNSSYRENDLFISRNDSFIIFQSPDRPGRLASAFNNDLFISFRKNDATWTNPKNLGSPINTSDNIEVAPYVTADNKYLFFMSGLGTREFAIYWVQFDNLLDSLKHTNFIPYLKNQIPNRVTFKDSLFIYQIPDSTFIDDDGNNTLTFSAKRSDGNPLPAWLSFDSLTHTFSGTPPASGRVIIKVTVIDTANVSVSCTFAITITNPTGIEEGNDQLPKDFVLEQNYPNPFNPSTTIQYSLAKSSFVRLNIYNMLGQRVRTLQNAFQQAGEHSIMWDATDERNKPVASGMYFYRLEADNMNLQKKMVLVK